jgi:SAM-dependent methyltransferase
VDLLETLDTVARERTPAEGYHEQINFTVADVSSSGLPSGQADFVWGEDAWMNVPDKGRLVAEAVRLLRSGGTIAFYDWCEGANLSDQEAERCMVFHKFPTIASLDDYRKFLVKEGCEVIRTEDIGRLVTGLILVLDHIQKQKTYDAMRLLDWNYDALKLICGELSFVQNLASSGKLIQGLFVARKL